MELVILAPTYQMANFAAREYGLVGTQRRKPKLLTEPWRLRGLTEECLVMVYEPEMFPMQEYQELYNMLKVGRFQHYTVYDNARRKALAVHAKCFLSPIQEQDFY